MFQYQTKTRDLYYDKAVDLYVREGLSYRQIAKILPVSKTTIMRWIAIFAEENPHAQRMVKLTTNVKTRKVESVQAEPSSAKMPEDIQSLQEEVLRLRAQLEKAEIKAEAYEELINVAESKFKISIRKKLAPSSREPACKGSRTLRGQTSLRAVWRDKAGLLQA